jgi:hypothetical protein
VYLARYSTLMVAALIASPALWHAFVRQDLDPQEALTRFLIAVPVSALMLALLRGLTAGYGRDRRGPKRGGRRRGDHARSSEAEPEPDAP